MEELAGASPSDIAAAAEAAEHAGEWERAGDLYRRLFDAHVAERDTEGLIGALGGGSWALCNVGRMEEAAEQAHLALELARRSGRGSAEAAALNQLATIFHFQQDLREAQQLYMQALEKARNIGDDALVAKACLNLGVIQHTLGNLREARALYLESVSAGLRSGFAEHAMGAYNNLGMVCTDLEEWLEAQLHLERGIEIAERTGNIVRLTELRTNRVEPLIHLNDLKAAADEAATAEGLARRISLHSALTDLARFRAMIAMAEGRLDDAEADVRKALAISQEHDLTLCRGESLEQLARLRRRQGRLTEALSALEQAFDTFLSIPAKQDVSRVAPLLEEWRQAARSRIRIGGGHSD